MTEIAAQLRALIERDVEIPDPRNVHVDESVDPTRIAPGVRIHPGCRLYGEATSIGPCCVLGEEAPVTLDNCQLGKGVVLKGGFFSGATFLDGVSFGSGAHVRPGTLLEEHSCCAHCVGLKQTVFMPFVVTGSLINFCDCLMAGGTGRENHSEVGSSYVHFNFTPHRDKATASLVGEVPRGVMLDQPPIFLGGQGGLVGPARIEYGVVTAAGTIVRGDLPEGGQLVFSRPGHGHGRRPFKPGAYGDVRRIVNNCMIYLGNIHALYQWYAQIRSMFFGRDPYDRGCFEGACKQLRRIVAERMKRVGELAGKVAAGTDRTAGTARGSQQAFVEQWPRVGDGLGLDKTAEACPGAPAILVDEMRRAAGEGDYIAAVRALTTTARQAGTDWLQEIVDAISGTLHL